MFVLSACVVCLNTCDKIYNIDHASLRQDFNLVSGLETKRGDGLPSYLCYLCAAYVKRFKKFREQCQRANYALTMILEREKEVNAAQVKLINRRRLGLLPPFSFLQPERAKVQTASFKWVKLNRPILQRRVIHVTHCSTDTDDFEDVNRHVIKIEDDNNTSCQIEIFFGADCENKPSTSVIEDDDYFGDSAANDNYINEVEKVEPVEVKNEDGVSLDEEYATLVPISQKEAKAAMAVFIKCSSGTHECTVCGRRYHNENRLTVHMRMHEKHTSGVYLCELCQFYYKTEFLLKTHTEKHLFKYLCKKCPDVNFDRTRAKQHYLWSHVQPGPKKEADWYATRPAWLESRGGRRMRGAASLRSRARHGNKREGGPLEFLVYSPLSPHDQYAVVKERANSRNYMESEYKCSFCYRGFISEKTYSKHMRNHDPAISGPLQCDMCKVYVRDNRYMYKHMLRTHLSKYACVRCDFVCYNRSQAVMHNSWHKDVTYKCTHCDLTFKKLSTRLTHIRLKHPSVSLCNLCGHSFVSESGVFYHKKKTHTREEMKQSEELLVDLESPLYCAECSVQFVSEAAFNTHLGSSSKHAATNLSILRPKSESGSKRAAHRAAARRDSRGDAPPRQRARRCEDIVNNGVATSTECEVCGVTLKNDVHARKHYKDEHPGTEYLKRYMCDQCGHATQQYANLIVHMRTHTQEKPYACPHCDRKFSMPSNRDRHIVVHTGEKKFECPHCHRRFTQGGAMKLHIQTVHMKIPYAPWDKKNRKRRKELEGALPPGPPPPPEPKLLVDSAGEYINAYITYSE